MRIAIAQTSPRVADIPANLAAIERDWAAAREQGALIVVTPELSLVGYPPRDLLDRTELLDEVERAIEHLAATCADGPALIVGAPLRRPAPSGRPLANAAVVLHRGHVIAVREKTLLPVYDVFDEARYFEPAHQNAPIEIDGRRISLTICEDAWATAPGARPYVVDPLDGHAGDVDFAINIAASPFDKHKFDARRAVLGSAAQRLAVPVLYCNQAGANDELIFDGRSGLALPDGGWVDGGARFAASMVVLDTSALSCADEQLLHPPAEELLWQALVCGIRDYFGRTGFRRAVIGISGGVDSALTAALAVEALGAAAVTGITMPSRFSSTGSVDDSQELAGRLGFELHNVSIEPGFAAMLGSLEPLFAGRDPDVTEENLQARLRGVIVMAAANKFGALVLTTGNKSELATGYCTLYGDMCGALAPLADLTKTEVYALCRWRNEQGAVIPDPILTKPPSAELRPDQTDQDSLPPYDVLDDILVRYVEQLESIDQIVAAGHPPDVVRRVVRLVDVNEYKRRQAAPPLKVSARAFGVGRRMPIAARHVAWFTSPATMPRA